MKAPASLAGKLARPDKIYQHLEELTDLVGLRVITFFEDSIEQVTQLIERHFRVDIDRSVDKRRRQDPDSFGYRSLHYTCHPPAELHRVERMKGFYQQLDYPDDEAEARRIARLFVKCFADWRGHSPA